MSSKKKYLYNAVLLISSLFLSLAIGEIVVRAFYGIILGGPAYHKLFMEYDPLLGWKKIPNNVGKHTTFEYSITERINSKGVRGPEHSYDKKKNVYRILILGDSFAEGYTVNFNELFSEQLGKYLAGKKRKTIFEVINMGTGGYSTDQELLLFQNEGKKYRPNLTILMFCDNDVWYNNQSRYWRGYKPLFRLDKSGGIRLTNIPVPRLNNTYGTEENSSKNYFNTIKRYLDKKSYLYRLVRERIETTPFLYRLAIELQLTKVSQKISPNSNNTIYIPDEFRVYERTENNIILEAWRITEKLIIKLQEEINEIGGQFLLFYIPNKPSVYGDDWKKMKIQYSISNQNWNIRQIRDKLRTICKKNGIAFLDSSDAFSVKSEQLNIEGKRLYFKKDGHWNKNGHEFVGEILAQYISRRILNGRSL